MTERPLRGINVGRILENVGINKNAAVVEDEDVAVIDRTGAEDRPVTWGEFVSQINQVANALIEEGLEPGDRIASLMDSSVDFYTLWFGAAKVGVTVVLLNVNLETDELTDQLERSDVDHLFCDDEFFEKATDSLAGWGEDVPVVVNEFAGVSHEGDERFGEFFRGASNRDPYVDAGDHDPLAIIFSMGGDNQSNGVVISHLNVFVGSLNWALHNPGLDRHSTTLNWLPVYYNGGHWPTFGTWLQRGTVAIDRGFDPESVAKGIEEYDVTHIWGLPSMFPPILEYGDAYDVTSLESVCYAMGTMPMEQRELISEEFDCDVSLLSGQSESFPVTHFSYPEQQLEKEGSVWGVSAPLMKHGLMTDEGDLITEPGEVGELVSRGPNVMSGYLDSEGDENPWENGWLRWGDLGYFDDDGDLVFAGRKKDMIKTGGENVSAPRVEDVLSDHEAVADVAVVGIPHPRWSEAVTAFVESETSVDEDSLIDFCEGALGEFEVPKRAIVVDDLPGDDRKANLREEYEELYRD